MIPGPPTTPGWTLVIYALWASFSTALSPASFRKVPVAEAGTNAAKRSIRYVKASWIANLEAWPKTRAPGVAAEL